MNGEEAKETAAPLVARLDDSAIWATISREALDLCEASPEGTRMNTKHLEASRCRGATVCNDGLDVKY